LLKEIRVLHFYLSSRGDYHPSDNRLYETLSLKLSMTPKKVLRNQVFFVVALILFSGFVGASVYSFTHSQGLSYAENAPLEVRVQNVSLSDYNAPAVYGTTQSNGTLLYIPPTTEGNLGFQIVIPVSMASALPQITVHLNGQSITGCDIIVTAKAINNTVEEMVGCMTPATPIGSSNSVTILVSSPLISATGSSSSSAGVYNYQAMITTRQAT